MFFHFCHNGEEESKKEDAFKAVVVEDSAVDVPVVDGGNVADHHPPKLTSSETSAKEGKPKVVAGEFACEDDMKKMVGGDDDDDDNPEVWIPLVDPLKKSDCDEETIKNKDKAAEAMTSNPDDVATAENKENNNDNKKKKRRKKKSKWQKRGGVDNRTPVLSPNKLELIREKQEVTTG